MQNICIYHQSCADGFGAALVVKKHFDILGQKCKFIPAHYGDEAPDVTGMNVVIVDFSYPRETLIQMKKVCSSIVVLDHHQTAKDNLEGLEFCHFDMGHSGAMLAWKHFFPNLMVPLLISYIQDRDLWQWQLDKTKEISAALQMMPFDFDLWSPYLEDDKSLTSLADKGAVVLEYQAILINNATNPSKIRFIELCGYSVPIANTTVLISEICGRLAENNPFAITYFDTPDKRIYSLRSCGDGGVDVSEIAKKFGGGGHRNASGFSLDKEYGQL